MGCVIAELFLEGKALFDLSKVISFNTLFNAAYVFCLSQNHEAWKQTAIFLTSFCVMQLLSYRRGEFDPLGDLAQIEPPMQQLIMHMIQLQPGEFLQTDIKGLSDETHLDTLRGSSLHTTPVHPGPRGS